MNSATRKATTIDFLSWWVDSSGQGANLPEYQMGACKDFITRAQLSEAHFSYVFCSTRPSGQTL